ncbi:MIF4G domain-containing protein [Ditylenchus destructor]|nr:MIF4G domain-containing protein [Ditylenchus destructor]
MNHHNFVPYQAGSTTNWNVRNQQPGLFNPNVFNGQQQSQPYPMGFPNMHSIPQHGRMPMHLPPYPMQMSQQPMIPPMMYLPPNPMIYPQSMYHQNQIIDAYHGASTLTAIDRNCVQPISAQKPVKEKKILVFTNPNTKQTVEWMEKATSDIVKICDKKQAVIDNDTGKEEPLVTAVIESPEKNALKSNDDIKFEAIEPNSNSYKCPVMGNRIAIVPEAKAKMNQKESLAAGAFKANQTKKYKMFNGRHSEQSSEIDWSAKKSIVRVKQEEPIQVNRSENAWKPKRELKLDSEDAKRDVRKKEVRSVFNKITPTTYADLTKEFCNFKVHEDEVLLNDVIEMIFDKAIDEPHFCRVYSDVCNEQVKSENELSDGKSKRFREKIIWKCQHTFKSKECEDKLKELIAKAESDETSEEEKQVYKNEIDALKNKNKRRTIGTIKFIAQLYRHRLLVEIIISYCVAELLKLYNNSKEEEYIEFIVQFFETVGRIFYGTMHSFMNESKPKEHLAWRKVEEQKIDGQKTKEENSLHEAFKNVDNIYSHLVVIKKDVSIRVSVLIENLEDLRSNNWIAKDKGPKTMDQLRADEANERIKNRTAHHEYQRSQKHQSYPGRGSGPANLNSHRGTNSHVQAAKDVEQAKIIAACKAQTTGANMAPEGTLSEFLEKQKKTIRHLSAPHCAVDLRSCRGQDVKTMLRFVISAVKPLSPCKQKRPFDWDHQGRVHNLLSMPPRKKATKTSEEWNIGDEVLCKTGQLELKYEAKITDAVQYNDHLVYTVKYKGYRQTEDIPHVLALDRFSRLTPESKAQAANERNVAKKQEKRAKSTSGKKRQITRKESIDARANNETEAVSVMATDAFEFEPAPAAGASEDLPMLPIIEQFHVDENIHASTSKESMGTSSSAIVTNEFSSKLRQAVNVSENGDLSLSPVEQPHVDNHNLTRIRLTRNLVALLKREESFVNQYLPFIPARVSVETMLKKFCDVQIFRNLHNGYHLGMFKDDFLQMFDSFDWKKMFTDFEVPMFEDFFSGKSAYQGISSLKPKWGKLANNEKF